MQKVIGVGGIIFKAKDQEKLTNWYKENLGIDFQYGYFEFKWADEPANVAPGSTVFGIFKDDTTEIPSDKSFTINLRVVDLDGLLAELTEKGVTVSEKVDEADFGRFGWLVDPEGNKVQLWEPANKSA